MGNLFHKCTSEDLDMEVLSAEMTGWENLIERYVRRDSVEALWSDENGRVLNLRMHLSGLESVLMLATITHKDESNVVKHYKKIHVDDIHSWMSKTLSV